MAVTWRITKADSPTMVVWKSIRNVEALVSDATLDIDDYPVGNLTASLIDFRMWMNGMFAQFNTDLTVAGMTSLKAGDSWLEIRTIIRDNFTLVDAVANP